VFGENDHLYTKTADPKSTHQVVAQVIDGNEISLRNVFSVGDELEILSPGANHNKKFTVTRVTDDAGQEITRANKAGYTYHIDCPYKLQPDEFLRKRLEN
jgi:hypothetical protein